MQSVVKRIQELQFQPADRWKSLTFVPYDRGEGEGAKSVSAVARAKTG